MRMVLQDAAHDKALPVDPGQLRDSAGKPRHLEAAAAAADLFGAERLFEASDADAAEDADDHAKAVEQLQGGARFWFHQAMVI